MFHKDGFNETSEDCLYLNVYSPHLIENNKNNHHHHHHNDHEQMPVMVWIHGGGFLLGSGNEEIYGPDFLIEHNVVLVTFNYRLGVFGFLNLGTDEVPGNAGLKDQRAVLLWVKKYIHLFGGNPNKVTLFGQSAGAASVQYHMLSNSSNGLFHQVILQSGSVLASWAFNENVKNKAFSLGKLLNCPTSNGTSFLLDCLRKIPSHKLKQLQLNVTDDEDIRKGVYFTFLPSIETPGTGKNNFLTGNPLKLLKNGSFSKVPTLLGITDLEGLMFLKALNIKSQEDLTKIDEKFDYLIPYNLGLNENSIEFQHVKNEIKKLYFKNKPLTWDMIKPFCDFIGDIAVISPVYRSLRIMMKQTYQPIYVYEFAVDGDRNGLKNLILQWNPHLNMTGASHFDDIYYLYNFFALGSMPVVKDSNEMKTVEKMTTLWTNFAKTGNPNGNGFDGWEPQQNNQESCLVIKSSLLKFQRTACEPTRAHFWNDVYNKYYSNL